MIQEYDIGDEKVFLIRRVIEVRFRRDTYLELLKKYSRKEIIQFAEEKRILHHATKRDLFYITRETQIPLFGHAAFGLIDRGTNLIQIRPITGCNLNCIFCSVDEGRISRTKKNDFIVDPDYLLSEYEKIAGFKGGDVEAHIDGQAEPFLYPFIEELLEGLRRIKETRVISIQTNGTLLNESMIDRIENSIDRINLSISALNRDTAGRIYGVRYPLEKVMAVAEYIAHSKIDLLIAPVWLPGINDGEIERIIEFALEIGAGKKWPPLGIQKYIPYRGGRKLKDVMSFRSFYQKLREWENEYGVKLVLSPKDFRIEKRKRYPSPIKRGEIFSARIVLDGRSHGERIAVVRDRVVTVLTHRNPGSRVRFIITRAKDGIYLGEEL